MLTMSLKTRNKILNFTAAIILRSAHMEDFLIYIYVNIKWTRFKTEQYDNTTMVESFCY